MTKMRVARWLALLLGCVLFVLWGIWGTLPRPLQAAFTPVVATDAVQLRSNTHTSLPTGDFTWQQTFTPKWDGLREVEVRFVRLDDPPNAIANANGQVTLRLWDGAGQEVTAVTLPNSAIAHNQNHVIQFPARPHSAAMTYTLAFSGNAANVVSLDAYSLDTYGGGALTLAYGPLSQGTAVADANTPADLVFVTRYQLTLPDALRYLGNVLWQDGGLMLLALAFLLLPGVLLLLAWRSPWPHWDGAAWVGLALALGTAVWPLLWMALTLLGGRWRGWSLWAALVGGWLTVLWLWWKRRNTGLHRELQRNKNRLSPLLLVFLLILALAVRLLVVRDVNVPLWVDASRHGLITAVMRDSGQTISDYGDYLPVSRFPYHYGFHTLSASLALLTGPFGKQQLPELLLIFGQLLNALVPLAVYAALWLLTRRREVGLLAAFLVAQPFFFPGYYVTWGRFTQLTAMLLMPLALALTWLLVRGGWAWRRAWWLLALLLAGLFLIHFRVFSYFLPFVGLVWLVGMGRNGRYLALSAGMGLLLISPRLWQLLSITDPARAINASSVTGYNAFPTGYLKAGWEQEYVALAGLCLALVFVAGFGRRRWAMLPLTLTAWVAALFLLLAGEQLGLPQTWLVNVNSMYITLFLPLAIVLAVTAVHIGRWLLRQRWWLQMTGSLLAGVLLAAQLLFGVRNQVGLLNPQTVLVQPPDLAGLVWVDEHVPETAVIAVNSWQWLGNTWAGYDGGAWLTPLTQRQTTTPPADYIYNADLAQQVRAFNEAAEQVENWADPTQAEWLRQQGVTHIFVGARPGGMFDPATLARNPLLQVVYTQDGVFVFEISN
ncbi:MAG: hypothetical protein H6664_08875 [Ardenticatenaceae bacterium]|nr:hypothetical protein [Ardenticatenaceae bacterium]MCB9004469.1 hypothetical protein [Ardenticatenaceae bacterium]